MVSHSYVGMSPGGKGAVLAAAMGGTGTAEGLSLPLDVPSSRSWSHQHELGATSMSSEPRARSSPIPGNPWTARTGLLSPSSPHPDCPWGWSRPSQGKAGRRKVLLGALGSQGSDFKK